MSDSSALSSKIPMAEMEMKKKTGELQSKKPLSVKKKKNGQSKGKAVAGKKRKKISPVKTPSPTGSKNKKNIIADLQDLQVNKLGISESPESAVSSIEFEPFAKTNAEHEAQLEGNPSCALDKGGEVEIPRPECRWVEPALSESDAEREESLKVSVPELPIFVHFKQKCPKLRRIPTSRPGLFIYDGEICLYWPKLHEIPTKFPDSLKEELREYVEEGDEKNFQLMIDNYEERYKLWHIYGKFQMFANDREHLEKNFDERLNELILQNSVFYHFTGKKWGYGTLWKREMSRSAKAQHRCAPYDRVLKAAKLWKKPLMRGQLKYDEATRRTFYKGSWWDEEDSDPETCPSPPRHWL